MQTKGVRRPTTSPQELMRRVKMKEVVNPKRRDQLHDLQEADNQNKPATLQ